MRCSVLITAVVLLGAFISCTPGINKRIIEAEPVETVVPQDTAVQDEVLDPMLPKEPILVMRLATSPCFGKCPVFIIELFDNGDVVYDGRQYAVREGLHVGKVDSSQVQEVLQRAAFIRFLELDDRYPSDPAQTIQDLPSTTTTLVLDGQEKKVLNIHDAPRRLIDFERYIIRTFEAIDYEVADQED